MFYFKGVSLTKKQAFNFCEMTSLSRDQEVCVLAWGDPQESEVGLEKCIVDHWIVNSFVCCVVVLQRVSSFVTLCHSVFLKVLVGCANGAVKTFSTEKGIFTENRECADHSQGKFTGLAVSDK